MEWGLANARTTVVLAGKYVVSESVDIPRDDVMLIIDQGAEISLNPQTEHKTDIGFRPAGSHQLVPLIYNHGRDGQAGRAPRSRAADTAGTPDLPERALPPLNRAVNEGRLTLLQETVGQRFLGHATIRTFDGTEQFGRATVGGDRASRRDSVISLVGMLHVPMRKRISRVSEFDESRFNESSP